MADKAEKILLEREYVIPLRRKFVRIQRYRRANRAIDTIRQFVKRHMKVYDDTKILVDKYLNEEIWQRGIKKPAGKIKVKVKKYEDKVLVELAEIPAIVKFRMDREKKSRESAEKKKEEKKASAPVEEKKEEKEEDKKEEEEKAKATIEAGMKQQEKAAKAMKHTQSEKAPQIHRMAMKK